MPKKSQNVTAQLTERQTEAAQLLAEDRLTDEEIAGKCGVDRRTLARWKDLPLFAAQVVKVEKAFAERALRHGLARKERRLQELGDIYAGLRQVVKERAEDPELQNVAGGKTGLITRNVKGIGRGDDFQVVEVYEVDTGTIKEMRGVLDQVSEETGQKVSRHIDLSGIFNRMSVAELEEYATTGNMPEWASSASGLTENGGRKQWTN